MKVRNLIIGLFSMMLTASVMSCSKEDTKDNELQEQSETGQDNEGTDSIIVPVYVDYKSIYVDYEEQLLLTKQYLAVVSILRTLTGLEKLNLHLDQVQYEPVLGTVLDESNPHTRAVRSESVEQSEASFRAIVGNSDLLQSTNDGYFISLRDMEIFDDSASVSLGSLTYHRGDGVREMGWVDVDIHCMPHLETIEYLAESAFPDNDALDSPYMVGDLVYYNGNKYLNGYYLCVRQSSGSGGVLVHMSVGKDAGGINLDGDDEGCWYPSNKFQGMKTESSHVEAYLSFLKNYPIYVSNLKDYLDNKVVGREPRRKNSKDDIFPDLWTNWQGRFGGRLDNLNGPDGFANEDGYIFKSCAGRMAAIVYDAYYGDGCYWFISQRIMRFWVVQNGAKKWEHMGEGSVSYYTDSQFSDFSSKFDFYTMNVITFRDEPVSGVSIEYSPSTEKVKFINSAENVTLGNLGWYYTSDNRLYESAAKARAAGHEPIGIVVYVNDKSERGDSITEKMYDYYGHGLVMSLCPPKNDPYVRWNPGSDPIVSEGSAYSYFIPWSDKEKTVPMAYSDFGGLAKTEELYYQGSEAAKLAMDFHVKAPTPETTGWFLPSAGQWLAIMCKPGLGRMDPSNLSYSIRGVDIEPNGTTAYKNINRYLNGSGVYSFGNSDYYWSSSAQDGGTAGWVMGGGYSGFTSLMWRQEDKSAKVRPVFAF